MRKVLYIFGLLTDADVAWLGRTGTRRRLADGEVLIVEGGRADDLILLLEGELLVTAEGFGQIARLGIGEIVGEMSLIDSAPPSATITASGVGTALFIDRTLILEKLAGDDGFGARFYRALAMFLADRLRATRQLKAAPLDDESQIVQDELDLAIMDTISAAGDRFSRLLGILNGRS